MAKTSGCSRAWAMRSRPTLRAWRLLNPASLTGMVPRRSMATARSGPSMQNHSGVDTGSQSNLEQVARRCWVENGIRYCSRASKAYESDYRVRNIPEASPPRHPNIGGKRWIDKIAVAVVVAADSPGAWDEPVHAGQQVLKSEAGCAQL